MSADNNTRAYLQLDLATRIVGVIHEAAARCLSGSSLDVEWQRVAIASIFNGLDALDTTPDKASKQQPAKDDAAEKAANEAQDRSLAVEVRLAHVNAETSDYGVMIERIRKPITREMDKLRDKNAELEAQLATCEACNERLNNMVLEQDKQLHEKDAKIGELEGKLMSLPGFNNSYGELLDAIVKIHEKLDTACVERSLTVPGENTPKPLHVVDRVQRLVNNRNKWQQDWNAAIERAKLAEVDRDNLKASYNIVNDNLTVTIRQRDELQQKLTELEAKLPPQPGLPGSYDSLVSAIFEVHKLLDSAEMPRTTTVLYNGRKETLHVTERVKLLVDTSRRRHGQAISQRDSLQQKLTDLVEAARNARDIAAFLNSDDISVSGPDLHNALGRVTNGLGRAIASATIA